MTCSLGTVPHRFLKQSKESLSQPPIIYVFSWGCVMQFCFKIKAFSNDNKKIHAARLWWSHPSRQGLWFPSETLLISWIICDYLGKPSDQGWAAYFSSLAFPLKGSGGKNVLVGQVLGVGLLAPLKGLAVWRKPCQASGFSDCPTWLVCYVRGAFGGTQ